MTPYLKRTYHTLDYWWPGRDNDGWKIFTRDFIALEGAEEKVDIFNDTDAPNTVLPISRFNSSFEALIHLFEGKVPIRVTVWLSKTGWVSYSIGDTSGFGHGTTVHIGNSLHFQYGQCASSASESSYNYRELRNLVDTVERLYNDNKLKTMNYFLFTDNLVADYAYCKGSSSSKSLFLLILRLRKLQMKGDIILHVM